MNEGLDVKQLSTAARKACKALHFSPTAWEPINSNRPADNFQPGDEVFPVMRLWNSKREVVLTNEDLALAHEIL